MASPPPEIESISPELIDALGEAAAYPWDESAGSGPAWVQTHISHVFLTGERVYKLRKAVDLGFLDFHSRKARNEDCLRELLLNRRLSPDVYLGIAPIVHEADGFRVGALLEESDGAPSLAEEYEYCVVMRRLPDGRDALSLLERGELQPAHLDRVAVRLARFHEEQRQRSPVSFSRDEWRRCILNPVEENFRQLDENEAIPRSLIDSTIGRVRAFADVHAERFERRRVAGRGVDGHGDLHLQHIWFEHDDAPALLIDCIEFNDALRRIDAASEVAFLAMDLGYRGRRDLAETFLRTYAREADDFDLYPVVDFFISYRAAVRAKVAAIASEEEEIDAAQRTRAAASAIRHLELGAKALEEAPPGGIVLVAGVVGCGKSTVAHALATLVSGVVISSDRVRKRLAGRAPTERGSREGNADIYTSEWTDRVYTALLERARWVIESGRIAILDATYSRRRHREEVLDWTGRHEIPVQLVEVRCPAHLALERLARRAAEGTDPSDAGPQRYAQSVATFEAPEEWPEATRFVVDTAGGAWRSELSRISARLSGRG